MNEFEEPVNLQGIKLVRALASTLAHLPENRQLPQKSFEIWSGHLAQLGVSESEMKQIGVWFAEHYQTPPAIPTIAHAASVLLDQGSLPPHRIASPMELNAMALLKAARDLGLMPDECAQSLMLAGTLAHLSNYRQRHPTVDRQYLGTEVEGIARQCNFYADEILDEIQQGKGELRELGSYLFS